MPASKIFGISIVLIIANAAHGNVLRRNKRDSSDSEFQPEVFLTVCALTNKSSNGAVLERQLELNWHGGSPQLNIDERSWVGLFSHDPNENINNPLVSVKTKDYPSEYYRTNIMFPYHVFKPGNLSDNCLSYWIAYVHANQVLSSSCIKANPNWMYRLKDKIGNKSLVDLMIPGTHNAGSYSPYNSDSESIFDKYMITQDEDIWNQLVYGNRYLDIRAGYNRFANLSSPENFWITHGVFTMKYSVRDVLQQVKAFLNATKEIVILDFHRLENGFSGPFRARRHAELIDLIETELGEYMILASAASRTTLKDMWDTDKRLYVGYAKPERDQSAFLNPGVRHLWANTDDLDTLEAYFEDKVCVRRARYLWSVMAQLTPSAQGVIFNKYGGLRKMTQEVNGLVTRWFRDRWPHCVNIVSTDFFLGTDIINVAIRANAQ